MSTFKNGFDPDKMPPIPEIEPPKEEKDDKDDFYSVATLTQAQEQDFMEWIQNPDNARELKDAISDLVVATSNAVCALMEIIGTYLGKLSETCEKAQKKKRRGGDDE